MVRRVAGVRARYCVASVSGKVPDAGTTWPLFQSERGWGGLALFGLATSTSVATWCFLIGGAVAYYLPAVSGSLTLMAGVLVGILLVMLSVVPISTKYGIDTVAGSKPMFGWRGSYFSVFLLYVSIIGWNAFLAIFLGKAGAEVLIVLGLLPESFREVTAALLGLSALGVVWAMLRKGPESMRQVAPAIALLVLALAAIMGFLLLKEVGWGGIENAQPLAPAESKLWNYTTTFEMMIANSLAWWAYAGGMVRLGGSRRKATVPLLVGLTIANIAVCIIGLWSALAIPESAGDPTLFLVRLGGTAVGIVALSFIILANVGTTLVGVYCVSVGIREIPALGKRSWNLTTLVAIAPVGIVLIVAPTWVYENIGTFLAFLGAFFAPVCGVQIADNLWLRKRHLSVRDLYLNNEKSVYHFWGGVNVASFVAVAAGWVTYVYLLHPVDFVSRGPYEYVTASLPAAAVAAAVHVVLTLCLVIPSGRGGYEPKRGSEPRPSPVTAHNERGL
jgi:NCS1 family nucleobase:cation symporter-1